MARTKRRRGTRGRVGKTHSGGAYYVSTASYSESDLERWRTTPKRSRGTRHPNIGEPPPAHLMIADPAPRVAPARRVARASDVRAEWQTMYRAAAPYHFRGLSRRARMTESRAVRASLRRTLASLLTVTWERVALAERLAELERLDD